ncbi:YqeG family HAD IIIA-type phosphatase [Gloeobacter kilaueensis]|uniref:UMP phosphatase n=1 Tax=Gloeobacter kilaueensis (strain ATCC BAA-2537 / CCAP 1431/1 / ULC 316 / JS1) TaxID=1183438 RepID=U5QI05_GLOK1|nr:YqeG family HAD IIIA-type phosphatase [Gloeobacter kilaueensis]AGY58556.1 UMP phosphatase [Gloeobacter kilaueensis JS1]
MAGKSLLRPDLIVAGPVSELSFEWLKQRHVAGLILDLDDTLLALGEQIVNTKVMDWVARARLEFNLWIVSNNPNRPFIESIALSLSLPYVNRAAKPSRRALRRVLEEMQLLPEQVAIVGDRLLTDVLAGNRLGLVTVLVEPPGPSRILRGRLLRAVERLVFPDVLIRPTGNPSVGRS